MSTPTPEAAHSHATPLERWLLPALALSGWVCGYLGYVQYELGHVGHADHLSAAYHGLQLLVLHSPHLEAPVPVVLQVGRYLGACSLILGLARLIHRALGTDLRTWAVRWRQGHVVISGLGNLGLQLARDARQAGKHPVVIERHADAPGVAKAIDLGIPVIIGDGCRASVLARAGAHRASEIFAVSGDDETNLGVAMMVEQLRLDRHAREPAQTWLFFKDPSARIDLQLRPLLSRRDPRYHIQPRAHDLDEERARQFFAALPLRHLTFTVERPSHPMLVLVGSGSLCEALVRQAALLAHFPGGRKLHILHLAEHAADEAERLGRRFPNLHRLVDFETLDGRLDEPAISARVQQACTEADREGRLLAAAICQPDDNLGNTRMALRLAQATPSSAFPIMPFLTRRAGMSQLLGIAASASQATRLIAFGTDEATRNYTTLCDETQDRLARAFHQLYLDQRKSAREKDPTQARRPAELPWEELPETFRDASRALADHLRIKLFTVGLEAVPALRTHREEDVPPLTEAQIALLSELEHARWCAERWMSGWSYARQRDDGALRHNLLIPWSELAVAERHLDRQMVENLRTVLGTAGLTTAPSRPR